MTSVVSEGFVARSDNSKVIVLLCLLFAARLLAGIFAPLHYDEAYYWLWSKHLAGGYYDHPPAVAVLIRLGVTIFGDTIFGVRSAFLFLGMIATWPIWRGVEILFGDERIGATAALYYNLTLAAMTSMMATPDVPLIAAFAFLLFSLAKLQQTGKGAWWLAAGLALGLGLMSKYTMERLAKLFLNQARSAPDCPLTACF